MITIILPISRDTFLTKVLNSLELLDCDSETINILAIVDGDEQLYVKARNLINDMKFNERLTIKAKLSGNTPRLDIKQRRSRISQIHNQTKTYIKTDKNDWVFLCEDDTTFNTDTLKKLIQFAIGHRAVGMIEGIELGRWGVPYVGAWTVDDIYNPSEIKSIENKYTEDNKFPPQQIDAGGFFCSLVRADLYANNEFYSNNGLGPDVNFGIEIRRLGYENYIHWQVPCTHWFSTPVGDKFITPTNESKIVTMKHLKGPIWQTTI